MILQGFVVRATIQKSVVGRVVQLVIRPCWFGRGVSVSLISPLRQNAGCVGSKQYYAVVTPHNSLDPNLGKVGAVLPEAVLRHSALTANGLVRLRKPRCHLEKSLVIRKHLENAFELVSVAVEIPL